MRTHFLALCLFSALTASAQDDLLNELEDSPEGRDYTFATFKGQRLVNGQTIETIPGGDLQFIFAHRFGPLNSGIYEFFGLDQAFVRIGLEYGISDRLGVGLGRNSVDKTVDTYLRYKVLRQSTGDQAIPVSVTAFGGAAVRLSPRNSDLPESLSVNERLAYTAQVLVARKLSPAVSLQVMPTLVHKNTVDQSIEINSNALIGMGGRVKVTKSMAVTAEYYHRLNEHSASPFHNPLGFGIDIETGGHVFQLVFTNARGLTERAFLTETIGDFFDGDIHFGFNVTRMFSFRRNDKEW